MPQLILFDYYYWYGFPMFDYEAFGCWIEDGVLYV